MARPMPEPPPVTTAVFTRRPRRPRSSSGGGSPWKSPFRYERILLSVNPPEDPARRGDGMRLQDEAATGTGDGQGAGQSGAPTPAAAKRLLIDGRLVGAGRTFPPLNPATGEVLGHAPDAPPPHPPPSAAAAPPPSAPAPPPP